MGAEESLVDFNRTGVPLMEIVSEPDIRSPQEASIFMQSLANLLQYIGVCDAKMEEGSLRCDANISIRPMGSKEFGTKTEVKNMNSFKAVGKALAAEEKRHIETLEEGGSITQETRFYDDITDTTTPVEAGLGFFACPSGRGTALKRAAPLLCLSLGTTHLRGVRAAAPGAAQARMIGYQARLNRKRQTQSRRWRVDRTYKGAWSWPSLLL